MQEGVWYIDGEKTNMTNFGNQQKSQALYNKLLQQYEQQKPVVIYNLVMGADGTIPPVAVTVLNQGSNTVFFRYGLYNVRVQSNGRVHPYDLTPEPPPATITATTDELFVQTYLDALADGATVVVTPKARTQGQMYSLNLGTKVIYLDFSGYTGTVSITCTGFTSQGNKVYKVTGAISPWIQSESATAITINED